LPVAALGVHVHNPGFVLFSKNCDSCKLLA
jgi:hypothetical protein